MSRGTGVLGGRILVFVLVWVLPFVMSLCCIVVEGVRRLEEEDREKEEIAAARNPSHLPEENRDPTMSGQQKRALTILRRLAFGMNRCVAKSNGEMAYQLLFDQEQLVTYRGYNMFFRYIPFAIMRCRREDMDRVLSERPDLSGSPLDVIPDLEGEAPVAVDEIGEILDEAEEAPRVQQVQVNFNQKDDYLHRGSSTLLQSMSILMYSRFVRRVPKNKAGKVDGVKFFEFERHYAHFGSSVQDRLEMHGREAYERVRKVFLASVVYCVLIFFFVFFLAWCWLYIRGG